MENTTQIFEKIALELRQGLEVSVAKLGAQIARREIAHVFTLRVEKSLGTTADPRAYSESFDPSLYDSIICTCNFDSSVSSPSTGGNDDWSIILEGYDGINWNFLAGGTFIIGNTSGGTNPKELRWASYNGVLPSRCRVALVQKTTVGTQPNMVMPIAIARGTTPWVV